MPRGQALLGPLCCVLISCWLVRGARAETDKSGDLVFVGLRALTKAGGPRDLRREAEARKLRTVAERALAVLAHKPVVGHRELVGLLGKSRAEPWVQCTKRQKCLAPTLTTLQSAGYRVGVAGDYYLRRGIYHVTLSTFSIADNTVIKQVQFAIAAKRIQDSKTWQAGISPLLEAATGTVKIESNLEAAACTVDDDPCVMNGDGKSLELAAGDHEILLSKDGYTAEPVSVTVNPGQVHEVTVALKAVEPPPEKPVEPAPAQPATPQPIAPRGDWAMKAVEIDKPIKIDGVLSDDGWSHAVPIVDSYQVTPTRGERPPVATVMRVAYDRDALYIGVDMETMQPDEPKATGRTRDDLGWLNTDDAIVVALDVPEGAGTAAIFGVNALGTQLDTNSDQNGDLQPFDYEFDSATSRMPGHWTAEMRIPWRELPLAKVGTARNIGVLFARFHPSRGGYYTWPELPAGVNDRLSQYHGHIVGVSDVHTSGAINLMPYVSGHALYKAGEPTFVPRGGGDARLRLGGFSAELTVLPDLTDVRPDDQTINLTRFELFRPELRPFFQSGLDVFSFGTPALEQMFYSRRIGLNDDGSEIPIVGGLKGYGRVGDVGAGILTVLTAPAASELDTLQLTPTVFQGVGGLQWHPTSAVVFSALGTVYADETAPPAMPPPDPAPPALPTFGTSFGAGLRIAKGVWQMQAFSSGTYNDADDNPPLGSSQNVSTKWVGTHLRPQASLLVINDTYNPLLGFVLRRDIAQPAANIALVEQLDSWIKEVQVIPTATVNYDHRFDTQLGYTAGVDVVANTALWSLTGFAHATKDTAFEDFEVLGEMISAGTYEGGDYAVTLAHVTNNPILSLTYERNNAFFTGHADTVTGAIASSIGSRLALSANASGTRATFPDQEILVGTVNASVAVTPVDHLHVQGLVGYNSLDATIVGIGSIIWQWSSRSRAALQVDHQPRLDMTSETQLFLKIVKDFAL